MLQDFITQIQCIDPVIKEKQLEVVVDGKIIVQIFESIFCVHNGGIHANQTKYNLMGASLKDQKLHLFTLQGLVQWDLEKNQESSFIRTEEIYCGDRGSQDQICTAHNKTIMIWDGRFNKPINCVLAHSLQITSCKFDDTAMYLVTSAQDNCSRVLHTYLPECLQTISMSKVEHTTHAQFMKDSRHIVVQTLNNPTSIWNWSRSQMIAHYSNIHLKNKQYYLQPHIMYNGSLPTYLLNSSQDGLIAQYDIMRPFQAPKIQKIHENKPVRFTCDDDTLYSFMTDSSKLDIFKFL